MEDGSVKGFDARKLDSPLYYFRAHSKHATSVMISPKIQGLMATAGQDGFVRTWDLNSVNDGVLKLVAEKNMKAVPLNLNLLQYIFILILGRVNLWSVLRGSSMDARLW